MPEGAPRKIPFTLALVCGLVMLLPWAEAKPPQAAATAADAQVHAAELLAAGWRRASVARRYIADQARRPIVRMVESAGSEM